MSPLVVRARLRGAVAMPHGTPALDGLLMFAAHMRDGDDALNEDRGAPDPKPIPLARSTCGRIYLASLGVGEAEEHEHVWINRPFPLAEAQMMAGPSMTRIKIKEGACKSFRLPLDTVHLVDDTMTWWAVGDVDGVRQLLVDWIGYIGKKRAVGLGRVARWEVEPCDAWPGFPVLRDGEPLRSLPLDWPGLAGDAERAYRTLLPAYSRRWAEEACAVPRWS